MLLDLICISWKSFKIGDVTYTYDQKMQKQAASRKSALGHPARDEIVIFYKASVLDSNRNSDHDSKPNPSEGQTAAPKNFRQCEPEQPAKKITFKKKGAKRQMVIKINMWTIKKFRKAKKELEHRKTKICCPQKRKRTRKYYVRVRAYQKINGAKNMEPTVKVKVIYQKR